MRRINPTHPNLPPLQTKSPSAAFFVIVGMGVDFHPLGFTKMSGTFFEWAEPSPKGRVSGLGAP